MTQAVKLGIAKTYKPVTLTLKAHSSLFSLLSVASHTTSVIPMTNSDPDTGVQLTTGFGSTLSTAVGSVQVTTAVERPRSVGVDMFVGYGTNCGGSSSDVKEC